MSPRPEPQHGTRARYMRGCPCGPCKAAHGRYCKEYRSHAHQTNGKGKRLDAAPVTERIRHLEACGYSHTQIASAAGVARRVIDSHARAQYPTISPNCARRILNVRLGPDNIPAHQPVDSTGTVRRLRALLVLGHPLKDIADATGHAPNAISKVLNGHMTQVRSGTARDIADLYSTWRHRPGHCLRTRLRAAREGWHSPLAWGDIDDPACEPDPDMPEPEITPRQRAAQRLEEIEHLARARVPLHEIAGRLALSPDYVRDRLRENHPRLFLELTA